MSCSKIENREKKDSELRNKITQLECGDYVQVTEIEYAYLVKRLRTNIDTIEFASIHYDVLSKKKDIYILTDHHQEHLIIILDQIQKVSYGGITKVPVMRITKICRK
ncbi:MAG: hypothetical protein WAZ12_01415 [Candidatus Absconditicoccaceae bacterium]